MSDTESAEASEPAETPEKPEPPKFELSSSRQLPQWLAERTLTPDDMVAVGSWFDKPGS